MTSLLIVGSRHFQPLQAVDELIWQIRPASIEAFGTSAVARQAVMAGELLGIPSANTVLDSGRRQLIDAARKPGAEIHVFVANDPVTRTASNGIAGIMRRLDEERIAYTRHESPCTAKTCETVTHLLTEVDKLSERAATEWRRKAIVKRLLARGLEADELRRRIEERMEAGWNDAEKTEANFAVWTSWLKSYECLCDALKRALASLTPLEAVALQVRGEEAA